MEAYHRDIDVLIPNAKDKKYTATTKIFNITIKIPKTRKNKRKTYHPNRMKMTIPSPTELPVSKKYKLKNAKSKASWAWFAANPDDKMVANMRRVKYLNWITWSMFTRDQAKQRWN
jgi:hypothetical protein